MAIADSAGLPIAISIASGSRHDVSLVEQTIQDAFVDEIPPKLIGDKGFDSKKLEQQLLHERGIELVAPMRVNHRARWQDGRALRRYKRRWKVERLFAWLKRKRRISTRWDVKAENYLGFLHLGCIYILLRQF